VGLGCHSGSTIRDKAADIEDAPAHVSAREWKTLRAYWRDKEGPKDSSGARRMANIRKLRKEREERTRKQRERRLRKQKG